MEIKEYLDSLSDEDVLLWLNLTYGYNKPKWKEISRKEYEKHCDKAKHSQEITLKTIEDCIKTLIGAEDYKAVPIYKGVKGILNLVEAYKKEPDYYKYYKKVGFERVIYIGGEIANYLNSRNIKWN